MKDFIKYTLATIVGLLLFSTIMTVIFIISIAGMAASEGMTSPIQKKSILKISLNTSMEERADEMPFDIAALTGSEDETIGLDEAIIALDKAAKNKNILGVYLEGGSLSATPAMAEELRHALARFKESGKWILAYGDAYSKNAYYLSSLADKIMLNPIGFLDWSGLASEPIFYKGLLEKVGVKMQVFKVGTYKSAVEPFINTSMSDANREQVTSFLTSIWNNMLKDVAQSRAMSVEQLNGLADSMTLLSDPTLSVKSGLVDTLCYISDVKRILKEQAGLDEDDDLRFVTLKDVAHAETLKDKVSDEIAVYYAYGDIVEETGGMSFSTEHQIVGKKVIKDLQRLREDDDVKAVVMRVNSGGGSAYASEQIWKEVTLLKEKKPVIVSMGGMAASGGYYISCAANKILAEASTLTGSIGIFGMIPDPSELLTQKLGLNFDVVKTNALSDLGAMGRPLNETEGAMLQSHINQGYELFTGRVADGRKMKQDDVKAIAEGRVWTGEQALGIGLVDKLGDLDDAIAAAAEAAGIEKYSVGRYPDSEPWYADLLDKQKKSYLEEEMRATLGEYYNSFNLLRTLNRQAPVQARIPFDPNIR
ncbi:MAG: signal peptide peptidase SppA [Bacteroidaceae bacterium]|nr:signal peptide peptidase SppA [Bacteroidaceae bacterium]